MRSVDDTRLAPLLQQSLAWFALATLSAAELGPSTQGASPFAPPVNDFCNAPVTLSLDTPITGTTAEAKNDYQLPSGACFAGVGQIASPAAGRDAVYHFKAPSAGSYSFRVTRYATTADLVLFVASSCPTSGTPPITVTSCLGAANRATSSSAEEVLCLTLAAGQDLFAFVDEHALSPTGSTFTIEVTRCVRETEPNDNPSAAINRTCPIEGTISPAGEVDFFRLGTPANGSRVFALCDGVAANSSDFDLRVTTTTDTREYDDADNDASYGGLAPNVAGTPLTGVESFLRVNHRVAPAIPAEPYRLYAAVQPGFAAATVETEPNDTTAQANAAANRYFRGTIGTSMDVDIYKIDVKSGDIVLLGLDGDPQRNNTPGDVALALLDAGGTVLVSVNDPNALSDVTSGAGNLTALTPRSPGEGIVHRATTTGTLYARVSGPPGIDYLLSSAINCRIFPATDLSLALNASPSCVAVGQSLAYVATITNAGSATARNVIFTDPLPSSVTYVSATPSQGSCSGGTTVRCQLGDLASGATATVTINVTANTATAISNTASVDSDVTDTNSVNDSASATTNGSCSDGNICTNGDTCSGGICVGGPPLDCSDANPCTTDSCTAAAGCLHANNNAPCEDGNPCSTGDLCRGGVCTSGACHGTCPTSGKECVQNEFEQCLCVDAPTPCGGTAPQCAGECPAGTLCMRHGTGTTCQCEPLPSCGNASGPQCAGTCPAGMQCESVHSPTADCACRPIEIPCATSTFPTCGGGCDVGYTCTPNGTRCSCTPTQPACGGAAAPRCAGSCGPHAYCRPTASGSGCTCTPLDIPCGSASAPTCNGRCRDDERCVQGAGALCICEPAACGDAVFPECGGACPAGSICRSDASQAACICQPDTPLSCGATSAPECGGTCPLGQICESDPSGVFCRCEPDEKPCAQAAYPVCAGKCPGDEVCISGIGTCSCAPPVLDCGQSTAPTCGGNCPDGQRCGPAILGDGCECSLPDPACGDARAPWCNGDCPPLTQCLPTGTNGTCSCRGCGVTPPSPDITLLWNSKIRLEWSSAPCATSYNVYRRSGQRLVDANHDGIADDYGACLFSGLATDFAVDTLTPPPGSMFTYLVTGENATGEGSLGFTSAGAQRPNRAPCP